MTRDALVAAIAFWRENVFDLDTVVDDCRRDEERTAEATRVAVRQRDRAAEHLDLLVKLHDKLADVGETFGAEVAVEFTRQIALPEPSA